MAESHLNLTRKTLSNERSSAYIRLLTCTYRCMWLTGYNR